MKRVWRISAKVLTGFFVTAMYAMPQAYTISAKPGVVNYIEGTVYLNGRPISAKDLKTNFLNTNDVVSTDLGKAEVLLTPGVFLRLGANTQVRMISLSLTDPQIEIKTGEAMLEVDDLVKDNNVSVLDHGGSVSINKSGLYRFTGGEAATVAVLEGKAEVYVGDRKTELGKGHQALVSDSSKSQKFNTKQEDDLYAWSNVRSEYDAASSYQAAKNVSVNNYGGGGWGDYGFAGGYSPGWFWNSGFNNWAWLPGNSAFYSPFGYGFYGPGVVGYAPVVYAPIYGGGGGGWNRGQLVSSKGQPRAAVPVNPQNPPAVGKVTASPFANQAARSQAVRSFGRTGFNTSSGMHVPAGRSAGWSGGSVGRASAGGGGHVSSGGASGGHASGSFGGVSSGGMSGGGHSGGTSGGGGHH